MSWPRVTVRPATIADLPILQRELADQADYYEPQDLQKSITHVIEYDGEIVGFGAGRLQWQYEPLLLTRKFKDAAPHFAQARGTYLLIRAFDDWLHDSSKNLTGITRYFCVISGKRMQQLAASFGMLRWYSKRGTKFFGKGY
jgi:hypothetical protein